MAGNPFLPTPPTRWRGSQDVKQGKVKWNLSAQGSGLEIKYTGPYDTLFANRPQLGFLVSGFDTDGMRVEAVEVLEMDAGVGEMTVTLSAPTAGSVSTAPLGVPVYEIEFQELQRPIEMHPKCGTLKSSRKSPAPNTPKRQWENWGDLSPDDYDGGSGKWDLATYKSIKEKGTDTYSTAAPVVRRTIYYFHQPGNVGIQTFQRQMPPAYIEWPDTVNGHSVSYLIGTDKCTRQGRLFTRCTEWLGAWEWNSDLYP